MRTMAKQKNADLVYEILVGIAEKNGSALQKEIVGEFAKKRNTTYKSAQPTVSRAVADLIDDEKVMQLEGKRDLVPVGSDAYRMFIREKIKVGIEFSKNNLFLVSLNEGNDKLVYGTVLIPVKNAMINGEALRLFREYIPEELYYDMIPFSNYYLLMYTGYEEYVTDFFDDLEKLVKEAYEVQNKPPVKSLHKKI